MRAGGRCHRLRGDRGPRPAGRLRAGRPAGGSPRIDRCAILTHCNTGPLACGQFGTALGVVQVATTPARAVHVWVDETRPYLQGARLTTWELAQAGVPHAHPGRRGRPPDGPWRGRCRHRRGGPGRGQRRHGQQGRDVHAGRAWRPATASRSTSPRRSAPSTSAPRTARPSRSRSGRRARSSSFRGLRIARPTRTFRNPSFDVTPAELISGIITDEGVVRPRSTTAWPGPPRTPASRPAAPATPAVGEATGLMATVAIGRSVGHRSRPVDRPGAPARSSTRTGSTRRTPSATSRSGSSTDPLGRGLRRRPRSWPSASNTPARRRSRCSSWAARRDRRRAPGRHPAARRLHRRPHRDAPGRRGALPGRPGPADGPDVGDRRHFRPYPATVQRLSRSRSANSTGSTSSGSPRGSRRAPSPTGCTTGCASTGSSSPPPGPTSSVPAPASPSSATC